MKLIAFCEAPADFRLMSGLVDRVLRASGPEWVIANFESPDVIRTWQPDMFGRLYFDLHKLNDYTKELDVRGVRGHFDGRPGGAGSTMARKIFLIARALNKKLIDEPIEAVVLVWDTDWQSDERPRGVEVAREEARRWATFRIICGFPDPEREAWVLAGFDPCNDAEQRVLEDLHRDLGFSPVLHAVRLRDKAGGAPRNIKRVLGMLTGDDAGREERCWIEPALDTLRTRGAATGLSAFLDELHAMLPSLFDRPRSRT